LSYAPQTYQRRPEALHSGYPMTVAALQAPRYNTALNRAVDGRTPCGATPSANHSDKHITNKGPDKCYRARASARKEARRVAASGRTLSLCRRLP